jgi:hypothetical protein
VTQLRDWLDLGKDTVSSLSSSDVAGLYASEWPQTKKMLIAEHRSDIEDDPRQVRRWLKTTSAIFYGLTKRLAPHRRVLFLVSFGGFFYTLLVLMNSTGGDLWMFVQIGVMFMLMTLLLAMELIDKLKYRDELQLARDLQASLIPKEMPQFPSYEVAAFNRIANTVGGDIYDFVQLEDGRVAILFGDASGHGMAAGLVMAVAHASFRTQLDIDPSTDAIFGSLNRILCRTGGSRSFFSCCYVLLSPDGSYRIAVAGHPQILKVNARGAVVERIGRGAYPLGIKKGLRWNEEHGVLAPGERLLLHSDGLTESRNADDREFDDAYVDTVASWHPGSTAATLVDALVGEWQQFMRSVAPEDDVSIAVVRRT